MACDRMGYPHTEWTKTEIEMKRFFIILALAALVFGGCRKEADYHPYIGETGDLAYNSYSSQFDYIWIREVLPTSYIIGERTFGDTGPLQPVDYIDLTYGDPFGNINTMHHDVYTSTFEAWIGGQVLEGIGCVPDQEVFRKDYNGDFKPQLEAAIEDIRNQQ